MPRPATGQTPVRNLRVPDEIWKPALANAQAEGRTITEVIIGCLKRYNTAVARRSARTELPNEDFDALAKTLSEPGEPVPELVNLFQRPHVAPPTANEDGS